MSVKQNLFVSVIVHECLMMLNDVEYATFKMIVTQMSNYLLVICFQLMFYKILRHRLPEPYAFLIIHLISTVEFNGTDKLSFLSMLILATSSQTFHSYFPLFDVDHLKTANCSNLTIVFYLSGILGKHCVQDCAMKI